MKKRIIALLMVACLAAGGEGSMAVQAEEAGESISQEEVQPSDQEEVQLPEQGEIAEESENTGGNAVKVDIAERLIEERISVEGIGDERDLAEQPEEVADELVEGVQEQSRERGWALVCGG